MASDAVELASGTDVYGIRWAVGLDAGALRIDAGTGTVIIGADQCDRFAEAVARVVAPGQVSG